ncbi:glycoside hydrolase family 27 protein [Lutibacter citreus]|uniref:glycoside hydrolase family 27 protein n=1 Tax=Lutibacter citreus TaxID=2138210 RepID=UPI0015D05766|nr:glycoside hydrolase family 27 protein [Lutibacter citreus]
MMAVFIGVSSCLNDNKIYDPVCEDGFYILTPEVSEIPRINGPDVFGVRSGNPFIYAVPVSGIKPIRITVEGLPEGLSMDNKGIITGTIKNKSHQNYKVKFLAENDKGKDVKNFEIKVGNEICLTPPLGWSSWIATKKTLSQEKVMDNVKNLLDRGLNNYGYSYVNIDDCWQGAVRGGEYNAIMPDSVKFPDIKKMVDDIHALGLKAGIYSTPWVTSYAGYIGGSSNNKEGKWDPSMRLAFKQAKIEGRASLLGKYKFDKNDAAQWAAWEFDYMKYDWNPNDSTSIMNMAIALKNSGRDIVFAISNSCPIYEAIRCKDYVQVFRTGGDIRARWDGDGNHLNLRENWDNHNKWLEKGFEGSPGHIPDPDFLMVGLQKYGSKESLTADQLYHHMSSFALWGGPLLLSTDLGSLSDFEEGLLTNVEILDINQDKLALPAKCVYAKDGIEVLVKELADGEKAIGIFNFNKDASVATLDWETLGLKGTKIMRDVWRQQDIGKYKTKVSAKVRPYGVVVLRSKM